MVKLSSLLCGLDVLEWKGNADISVSGVCHDSRKVDRGNVFVAIPGARQDGSSFIREAIERGACAIVAETPPMESPGVTFVRVANSRKALAGLAAVFFGNPSHSVQLIGVTGTNGKTTTTLLLEGILKHAGHGVGVVGTLGYRWADKTRTASMTTPESLDLQKLFHEMHRDGVSHVVMEVSSHALALGRVDGCTFRAGVFTNLSQDHLDFHKTMEDYFTAKTLLFKHYLSLNGKGSASIINGDDDYGRRLVEMCRGFSGPERQIWSYSVAGRDARVWVRHADLTPSGICATLATPLGDLRIDSPLLGRLNLYNLVAAATTALALGFPKDVISGGLAGVSFVDGRLQRVPVPREAGFDVVVDYAHTPDAMEKSLGCLREMTQGRLFVVFGCGGDRDRSKRPLMGRVAAQMGDVVILTSDNPRSEAPWKIIEEIEPGVRAEGLTHFDSSAMPPDGGSYTIEGDRKRAIELALSLARPGDLVFIGGKGHETYQIIGGEVFPFDDRQVVQSFLENKGPRPAVQPLAARG